MQNFINSKNFYFSPVNSKQTMTAKYAPTKDFELLVKYL